ncbi:hypothetical protein Tco_1040131, partial [Tanacetum coccineum]
MTSCPVFLPVLFLLKTPLASLATQHCVVFGLCALFLDNNGQTLEDLNQRVIEQSTRSLDIHGVSFKNNASEHKLQKKLTDVCEKEQLYRELASTTKNYDLDVDDNYVFLIIYDGEGELWPKKVHRFFRLLDKFKVDASVINIAIHR